MSELKIRRSDKLQQINVIGISIISVLLVILSFAILRGSREFLGIDFGILGWIIRLAIVLTAVGAIWASMQMHKSKQYSLRGGKLTITNKAFGSRERKQVITLSPKTVSGVYLSQSYMEKRMNTGNVTIEVDSMSGLKTYTLENIDNPRYVVENFESYLK